MTLEEFKRIFYYEYTHRLLGRFLGLAFILPAGYFISKKYLSQSMTRNIMLIGAIIGLQGGLGWYMVKSGLRHEIIDHKEVPRVSHYRLAMHLGSALLMYTLMLWNGFNLVLQGKISEKPVAGIRILKHGSHLTTMLIFMTALSGIEEDVIASHV
jgi:cytochrome c oxidase assembly protein subunit 15